MATTTNYGWSTPDDTDLVKDGAAAIRALGSSIDTSFVDLLGGTTGQLLSKTSATDMDFTWVSASGGGALTKISTTSFTSSSALSQNDVFSATYKNYLLLIDVVFSGANVDALLRLRASGTDSTTSYTVPGYLSTGSAVSATTSTNGFGMVRAGSTTSSFGSATLFSPFEAAHTGFLGTSAGSHGYNSGLGGRHTVATSYDGFTLLPSSGTFTGTVTLYGIEA